MKDRIEFLDIAKAICIVLVVLGHLNPVPEPQAWAAFVKVIYSFHMPLFLFVCGFLFNGSYRNRNSFSFISRKFKHLMLPYFGASVFIIGVKLLAQMFVSVKNPVSPVDFLTMFYRPSAAIHLWFIWVLMILYLLAPLFAESVNGSSGGFFLSSALLQSCQFPRQFPTIVQTNLSIAFCFWGKILS